MGDTGAVAARAARLRALHVEAPPLILANAWDAASARVLAGAGFPAIATGSEAVAGSLGYEDGEAAPVEEMFAAARRITGAVDVPVTVDAEAGYGLDPPELVDRLIAAGAAGCNIEDSVHPAGGLAAAGDQAERLAAMRAAARAAGVDIVINARVDVYISRALPDASADERLAEAVRRGRAYLDAGADCVYPILAKGEQAIDALVRGVPGPINVLFLPGGPSLVRLAELGVARVTFGGGLHRATMHLLGRLATKIRSRTDPY